MQAVVLKVIVGAFFMSPIFVPLAHATAQEIAESFDCDCGTPPYVFYMLDGDGLELDENRWRVAVITAYDADLTQSEEPAICEVKLDLIPANDPVAYTDLGEVSDGDFEMKFEGELMLASDFAKLMAETSCLSSEN